MIYFEWCHVSFSYHSSTQTLFSATQSPHPTLNLHQWPWFLCSQCPDLAATMGWHSAYSITPQLYLIHLPLEHSFNRFCHWCAVIAPSRISMSLWEIHNEIFVNGLWSHPYLKSITKGRSLFSVLSWLLCSDLLISINQQQSSNQRLLGLIYTKLLSWHVSSCHSNGELAIISHAVFGAKLL